MPRSYRPWLCADYRLRTLPMGRRQKTNRPTPFKSLPTWKPCALSIVLTDWPKNEAAWNPAPTPLEEFLQPKIPLKERYPSTEVDLPTGWEIGGLARWTDNRYLLVTLNNPDIHPAKQRGVSSRESWAPINERIYVLDSDTGNTYFLKTLSL